MSEKTKDPKTLLSILKNDSLPSSTQKAGGLKSLFQGGAVTATAKPVVALPREWKPLADGGRLAFVIDATASRQPTWEEAKSIQGRMFKEASQFGDFSTRLIHFQGSSTVEVFPASRWSKLPDELVRHMNGIECQSGNTQIERALNECAALTQRPTVIVAIGDACEESIENIQNAGRSMKKAKIPVFSFFEGDDEKGRTAYQLLAKESGGIFARFGDKLDLSSLVVAAAAYSAGGLDAVLKLAERPGANQAAARVVMQQLLALDKK